MKSFAHIVPTIVFVSLFSLWSSNADCQTSSVDKTFQSLVVGAEDTAKLESSFTDLPIEARRLTGPLFWLHGDESAERLADYVGIVAQGGNGCFTAESRPHNDWLGEGWYRDLAICLEAAKKNDLQMWIFDERWWPSGEVGGKVPEQYASKRIVASMQDATIAATVPSNRLIAVLAAQKDKAGNIISDTIVDLSENIENDKLEWKAPDSNWAVMTFCWEPVVWRNHYLVDGASRDAADWFIKTVYQPHYDRFPEDFGKSILGYFYDEPETPGDWGTEVAAMLKQESVDWKKALVAWKFTLADPEEQIAMRYQYHKAYAEAVGSTLYGTVTDWCHRHGVISIGHWLEHRHVYLDFERCAGNMFQVQKYSDMGAIDAVYSQFVPGKKDNSTYQTPKLGSSISHAYGKPYDLSMVEIFGARGQNLSYLEMKWWTDHMQSSGINFHIPHSFNPRSPYDRDCPPYFYNGGHEPRWPLYRVYADYTSRLSTMLTEGRHVCPVAFLFLGNSAHVGERVLPEEMTTALQDALFDCDWIPYEVLEDDMESDAGQLKLRDERYRILVVPAVEVIPFGTMVKIKSFYDAGGTVIGYGILPSKSATPGRSVTDIESLRKSIWGDVTSPALTACNTNSAGGRSYFLPEKPTPDDIRQALTGDAGIHPTCEILEGESDDWLHVLHRVKAGSDIFFITNMQWNGDAKTFRLRIKTSQTLECWDALRGLVMSVPQHRLDADHVEVLLPLESLESVLLVGNDTQRDLLPRIDKSMVVAEIEIPRQLPTGSGVSTTTQDSDKENFEGLSWVWHDEPQTPPGTRYFRGTVEIDPAVSIADAQMVLTADNDFTLHINGQKAGAGNGQMEGWRVPSRIDINKYLRPGKNTLAIEAVNFDPGNNSPNPAGLIGFMKLLSADGNTLLKPIDSGWTSSAKLVDGWQTQDFDGTGFAQVKVVAQYGRSPWGKLTGRVGMMKSPVEKADPFVGSIVFGDKHLDQYRRAVLVMEELPRGAAAVRVNGQYAGGVIGKPWMLDITDLLKPGENQISIDPLAPKRVLLRQDR